MEHEITYLDGAYVAMVTGTVSFIERETYPDAICSMGTERTDCDCCEPSPREVAEVVVETDGAAVFIPAKLVLQWKAVPA